MDIEFSGGRGICSEVGGNPASFLSIREDQGVKPSRRIFGAVVGAILAVLLGTGDAWSSVNCYFDPASSHDTVHGFFVDPTRKTALSLRLSPCSDPEGECDHNCVLQHEDGPIAQAGGFDGGGIAGVCRDSVTGLDHALVHTVAGQYTEIQFWSVDPVSGEVKRAYEEAWSALGDGLTIENRDLLVDADGRCLWRDRQQGHEVFLNVLSALRVGQDADLPEGAGIVLPVRELSAEVATQQLLALDAVQPRLAEFEAAVYADQAGRTTWRVIQVMGTTLHDARGVVLVEDRRTETWQALYDIRVGSGGMESLHYPAQFMVVAGNTLTAKLPIGSLSYHIWGCFEIDLPTSRATSLDGSVCDEMRELHYPDWDVYSPDDEKPFDLRQELGVD